MTTPGLTATTEQIAGARRLFELADEVRQEHRRWRARRYREELAHVQRQLDEAGRIALTAEPIWAEAWAMAGLMTLRKYQGQRKLMEHLT